MHSAYIAAMPDAVAAQASPPSKAARRSSKARTVGLVYREYTFPSRSPPKVAAASAAEANT